MCSMIQKRTMRKAGVLCPLPPAEGDYKPEAVPSQMHCGACAEQLKTKRLKMRAISAGTDLSSGKVTVTGTMNGEKLVEYIRRRTGKAASIVPQPPKEEQKRTPRRRPLKGRKRRTRRK
ncbi:unnamed protein product [Musa hybrid cultivar]